MLPNVYVMAAAVLAGAAGSAYVVTVVDRPKPVVVSQVVRVVDAETVEVRVGDRVTAVRLVNVDAPAPGECLHLESRKRLDELLPPTVPFVLLDDDQWGCAELGGRPVRSLVRAGGAPADDAHAIAELEARRAEGVRHLVLAWPAFWWNDYYRNFARHLLSTSVRIADDEHIVVHELRDVGGGSRCTNQK